MANKTKKNESKGAELMQAYLKVIWGSANAPMIVLRKASDESHSADLVPLPGVVMEANEGILDCAKWSEHDSWEVCSKVADRLGLAEKMEKEAPSRNAYCEHLAYAYSILCDYVKEFYGDYTMSKETAETLIRGAIDRIVRAGKCFGLRLDQYRSDD
jgi:hypothetical protein